VLKLFESPVTFGNTFEPSVQLLKLDAKNKFTKLAAHTHHCIEIEEYLNTVTPEEGKSYLLILALGASDYYGCNRNGDWFDESELLNCYKTFETEPAYMYRHHQNKDPDKAAGVVVKSFYNSLMHRVEIIVKLDKDKAPDVVDKLESGVPVATSMGCRVQYDVCSKCGNKAKTRAEYCDHLKFNMRHIDNAGFQVYAINKFPKFFDISLVFRPADRTSYVLKKVASQGSESTFDQEYMPSNNTYSSAVLGETYEKISELRKISDIIKAIKGYPVKQITQDSDVNLSVIRNFDKVYPDVYDNYSPIDDNTLDQFTKYPLSSTISSLTDRGISLTTPEISKIIIARSSGCSCSQTPDLFGRVLFMMILPLIRFKKGESHF
jgi:hypothetical protein